MLLPLLLALKSLAIALPFIGIARRFRLLSSVSQLPFLFLLSAAIPAASAFLCFTVAGHVGILSSLITIPLSIILLFLYRSDCVDFLLEQKIPFLLTGIAYVFWLSQEALLPAFSGAWWERDWYRHFFFADAFLKGHLDFSASLFGRTMTEEFFGRNWLCSFFAAYHMADWPERDAFQVYQVSFVFLGLAALVATAALTRVLFGQSGRKAQLLVYALMPFIPTFAQNACYPWPKMFVVAAVVTYFLVRLEQLREPGSALRSGLTAGVVGAIGILAHLGAAPYLIGIELSIAALSIRKPLPWIRHALVLGGVGLICLAPYYGWLLSQASLDTIRGGVVVSDETGTAATLHRIFVNSINTVFPYKHAFYMKPWPLVPIYAQLRVAYDSIAGILWPVGWLLFAISLIRQRRTLRFSALLSRTSLALLGASFIGGLICVAMHDGADPKGLMTVVLLPVAAVILSVVIYVFSRETPLWLGCFILWIAFYGLTVRFVHLYGLHQGFLLDSNYTNIQKAFSVTLWNDNISDVGEAILTSLIICSGALLILVSLRAIVSRQPDSS